MLEFIEEELSGQLAAHSNTVPFKTYWIEDGAWAHLYTVTGDRAGANTSKAQAYHSVEDAIAAANEEDSTSVS